MSSHARTKAILVSDFRRTQILDAARLTFGRHGLSRTTVAQIARAARVAKGTVYLYFRSKDEILHQLLDEDLTRLHDETVPAVAGPGSIEDRLRLFLLGMLGFFDRNRDFIEQCHFGMTPEVRTKARHKVGQIFAAQRAAWQAALTMDRDAPPRRAPDPRAAALGIVSLAHGLALPRLRGWAPGPVAAGAASATALLWKGLESA
jgi:AcrR family transcriptional regulator